MIKNPFACIGLSFAATLFTLNLLPDFTLVLFAASAVCLGLCLFLKSLPERGSAAVLFLGVMAAAVLFTATQKAVWEPALAMDRQTGTLSGTATGETSVNAEQGRYFSVIRTDEGLKVTIVTNENYDLEPGDRVTFTGKLYADQTWSRRAGRVFLTCWYPKNLTVQQAQRNWARDWPFYARRFLIERITQQVGGEAGDAAAAMVTGEREGLSDETYTAFRRAGVAHIIAVSGLHMNLIVLALYGFLRRALHVRRQLGAAVSIAAAWAYAAAADFTPSAVRACIMVCAFFGAMLFHRRISPLNSLGLAAFSILLFNPYAVCSASFELSFAATLGLLTIGRKLLAANPFDRVKFKLLRGVLKALYATLAITFSATVGCLPVYLFLGIDATFASFVTNLATFFAVAPALITGLFTALPGVFGRLSALLCRLCVNYILLVVHQVSGMKWLPLLSLQAAVIFAAVFLLGFLFSACRKRIRKKKAEAVRTKE